MFSYTNTFLAALIGAIIGQISLRIFNWIQKKFELRRKKELILDDLKNQELILGRMEIKLNELKNLFESRNLLSYKGDTFHDLTKDIYESVSKLDLFEIFKKKLTLLVDIYGSIIFLKTYGPIQIYEQYTTELRNHLAEKKSDSKHDFYCEAHLSMIEKSIRQIANNLNTIKDVTTKIKQLNS